jgi:hypothetical protein
MYAAVSCDTIEGATDTKRISWLGFPHTKDKEILSEM